jgi:hypothetical protein
VAVEWSQVVLTDEMWNERSSSNVAIRDRGVAVNQLGAVELCSTNTGHKLLVTGFHCKRHESRLPLSRLRDLEISIRGDQSRATLESSSSPVKSVL